jgi:hypothetical protein
MGSTIWEENDLCFSTIMATLRLLNIDAKKWSVDRRLGPINP